MKKFFKENWSYIVMIILVLFIRSTKVIGINIVSGESMMSTLYDGQVVFGSSIKNIQRGDIIVAKTDKLVVKRVIGLPGETISYHDGELYVNGTKLEESYIEYGRDSNSKKQVWEFTCGEDEFLILGDNRDNSYDGRYYGPLPKEQIVEKVYIQF